MVKLREHGLRQTPCRPASHFCPMCNKGLSSYKTLWQHKRTCPRKTGLPKVIAELTPPTRTNIFPPQRIQTLKQRTEEFFQECKSGGDDCYKILSELNQIFPNKMIT